MAGKYSKKSRTVKKTAQPSRANRKASGQNSNHTGGNRKIVLIAICAALVAVVAGLIAGYFYLSNTINNGLILDNITVAGVDVGGMSKDEAIAAVSKATSNTYTKNTMVVQVLQHKAELAPSLTGAKLDVEAAVDAAYDYGRTGSRKERKDQQYNALMHGYSVDLSPYLSLNTQAIKNALSELGKNYDSVLTQSTFEITGQVPPLEHNAEEAPGKTLVIKLGTPEYGLDLNALYAQVMQAYSGNVFSVDGKCTVKEPDPIDLKGILDANYIAPINATIDPDTSRPIPEVYGYGFDLDEAKTKLADAEYGATVEIPFVRIAPEITSESLTSGWFKDVLGTYTGSQNSDENRATNLDLACKALNGVIIYPGEVFSYNETLGERTAEKGYKPGAAYVGNATVNLVGGGICQVSTMLYNCALLADLQIVERWNHTYTVVYTKNQLGVDATVSWGALDFRFRNTTNNPIRIEASASGGTTTVTIYGTDDKDYYVKMESETLATYPYETKYEDHTAEGYAEGKVVVTPYTGYDVKSYRCKYDKETNELISKKLEATSTYKVRDKVICKVEVPEVPTEPSVPEDTTVPEIDSGITDTPGALPEI